MKLKKDNAEKDFAEIYELVNSLIHENKITFNYNTGNERIEPIQVCYNKKDEKIEVVFRNNMQEYIDELRALNEQYEKNHK